MKIQILLVAALAIVCIKAETFAVSKRQTSCETVFSAEVCAGLKTIAKNLKLLPSAIEKGIQNAVAKGEKTGPEIYKEVIEFLKKEVLNKECEYFLSSQLCIRIRKAVQPLNLIKVVGKFVIEAIVKGPPSEYEIFLKVLNLVRKEVVGKRCDELLAQRMCAKLEVIAKKLLIKAEDVARYVVEAMIAGYSRRDEIYAAVLKFFRDDITSLQCENILSSQACSALRNMGKVFKMSHAEINDAVKEAVLRGKTAFKEIFNDAKEYIEGVAKAKTCEDLLPDKFCADVKSLAAKLKIKAHVVDEAVKEALRKGKTDFKEFLLFCKDYFKQRMTCESWLGEKTCKRIHNFARAFGVKIQEVEDKIKDFIADGKTAVSDIYKEAIRFIRSKIFG